MDPDERPKYQQLFVHINDLTYMRNILLFFYIEIQRNSKFSMKLFIP